MPTTIAIEAKPLDIRNIQSGFYHLYLVKTVTDDEGNVISEKVIRGTAGSDGRLHTLADANLATSPDRRGFDTLQERHHTELDLDGQDPEAVWSIMVQHAVNIDHARLNYSLDIYRQFPGYDVNSNSVAASVMHSVGINWLTSLPTGISRSEAPLYGQLQYMYVNDVINGTPGDDHILGGVGQDSLRGRDGNDRLYGETGNDRLYGGAGDDYLSGSSGNDRLYGGSGHDTLYGGSGSDAFVFSTQPDGTDNVDSIRDFSTVYDRIWLDNSVFTEIGRNGTLRSSAFWTGTEAHDVSDRVIYDRGSGTLYYDPDGNGEQGQVVVAELKAGLKMNYGDFLVV